MRGVAAVKPPAAESLPLAERALGLETQPQPGDLDNHGSHPSVARLADALITLALPTVEGVPTRPARAASSRRLRNARQPKNSITRSQALAGPIAPRRIS